MTFSHLRIHTLAPHFLYPQLYPEPKINSAGHGLYRTHESPSGTKQQQLQVSYRTCSTEKPAPEPVFLCLTIYPCLPLSVVSPPPHIPS